MTKNKLRSQLYRVRKRLLAVKEKESEDEVYAFKKFRFESDSEKGLSYGHWDSKNIHNVYYVCCIVFKYSYDLDLKSCKITVYIIKFISK